MMTTSEWHQGVGDNKQIKKLWKSHMIEKTNQQSPPLAPWISSEEDLWRLICAADPSVSDTDVAPLMYSV